MAEPQTASRKFDVAIIGAGVVGCALARRLTLDGAQVVVLEKAPDVLDGASKGNSAILHTGFDAPPGSLEQACIARGYREYLDLSEELGLPILKTGALVLAWNDEQVAKLPSLMEKARKNGVEDVEELDRADILKREPHLSETVAGGFLVPGEYLIDPWTTAHAYLLQALENGAEVRRDAEVLSGNFDGAGWTLSTTAGPVEAGQVINSAGLYGDIVDQRLLGQSSFKVTPRKGQFVVFDKTAAALASAILLPVPTEKTKGIVVCRTIFGNLLVGPTAEDQESRTDASTDAEMLQGLRDRGIEMIPELEAQEVTTVYAGLRPATEYQDFQIQYREDQAYVTVGGIRSTGLSAALGIARHVSELMGAEARFSGPLEAPILPRVNALSNYHERDWERPDNGGIVCHCELVTRREIEAALDGPLPPATLAGLKRRTRVCMGRCQGFYCTGELAKITAGRFKTPIGDKK
ncbi:NAD(P)/FAD-dependent oxidoreductase [Sneathiella chinensis]|uniref:FAD/NAD(P)-binding oxidoreductase n=1 Tax=Sneathiella chinensis TaxID=349750 RepID=A0ABQ5U0P6_9PROT|nr:NAD(P)/FAD-dependent oxidoreductase [Sneathiella chinensis]GLQ05393.1 FAD/NAD(P)-binding oxidoreductase [Sneathiella chinensis]